MPNSVFLGEREQVRQTVIAQTQAGLTCSRGATQSFSSWHNLQPSLPAYRRGSSGLWPPARNACARWASPASPVSAEDTHPPVCLHKPANDTSLHQQTILNLTACVGEQDQVCILIKVQENKINNCTQSAVLLALKYQYPSQKLCWYQAYMLCKAH